MPKPKDIQSPVIIEEIPTNSLLVEEGFNVRSPKQFAANVKELLALVEASGKIDGSIHCVQYIERGGKKYIRGGHTIHAVAEKLGYATVPAIKVSFDAIQEQINLVISNAGHPLTPYEQGTVYLRLADGESTEGKEPGESVREAMTTKDIAARAGYTEQHIKNCIAVRQAPKALGEMILDGTVSENVIRRILQLEKNEAKQIKFARGVLAHAKSEKSEKATMKHLDAVKADYVTPKPLKAAPAAGAAASAPSTPPASSSPTPTVATPTSTPSEAPETTIEAAGDPNEDLPVDQPSETPSTIPNPVLPAELNLDTPRPPAPPAIIDTPQANHRLYDALLAGINYWDTARKVDLMDGDAEALAKALIPIIHSHFSPI